MSKMLTAFGLVVAAMVALAAYPYVQVDAGKILITDGKIQFAAASPPVTPGYIILTNGEQGFLTSSNGNMAGLFNNNAYSLSVWWKGSAIASYNDVLAIDPSAGTKQEAYVFGTSGNNLDVAWRYYNTSGINLVFTNVLDNNWHHILFSSNGTSGTNACYVDGNLVNKAVDAQNITGWSPSRISVFKRSSPDGKTITGNITMIRCYNRALSASEAAEQYGAGVQSVGGITNGLLAEYRFTEGSGTVCSNAVDGITGDVTGGAGWGAF
jgi:hypothetical protein